MSKTTNTLRTVDVAKVHLHPQFDVALVELGSSVIDVRQLILFGADANEYLGATAQIAGYGRTEQGTVGALRFAIERIRDVSTTTLTAQSISGSGNCLGDSGGPMMVRDDTGAPVAIGLLWKGSAACNKDDVYLRTDMLRAWVASKTGNLPEDDGSCGGISPKGECFSGVAVWCDANGQRAATRCPGGMLCGWSTPDQGYRCVAKDPCAGVDGRGVCDGPTRVRSCQGGGLVTVECEGCSSQCEVSGADAFARCAAASLP
jgi:hypothetical protein